MELKLSDSFVFRGNSQENTKPSVEVRAIMLNINLGHNEDLMQQCRKLWEYAYFVAAIRDEANKGASFKEAAGHVFERCIEKGILKEILSKYRTEVIDMILEEYDEQRHIENERNISREEGREAVNQLNRKLLEDKRLSDLERASADPEYQVRLLKE